MQLNDKIIQALGLWRRKLLDLSKRNKALNFKSTKVTTIAIVDEQPGIVFKYLFTDGKQMKFAPILPSKKELNNDSNSQQIGLFEPDSQESLTEYDNSIFQEYKIEELEDRHTDNILQCNCTPENLDTSLRRTEEILRSNIEEQGVHTLFLALGMLYYTESDNSEEVFKAPIILLPVIIERKSARSGYTIQAGQDDPMVNPTLVEYLKQSYNICFPEIPDFTDETDFDLQAYFIKIVKLIEQKPNWSLKNDIFLTHFTFQKFVMFKDIERNTEAFKAHRLVSQLVTKEQSSTIWGLPPDIQGMNLDKDFPPEETFTILDADSSQLRAMAAIAKGYDIVIEGPPGTGKSQTIVNIIAQGLSQNKSILFVSEKLAALQVVHRRLKEVGLDEFCLELHSTKGNRKEVIDELKRTLDLSLLPSPSAVKVSSRLKDVRNQLTEYANKVHAKIEPLGMSPFEAFGKFGEVFDNIEAPFEGEVKSLTKSKIDENVSLLNQIITLSTPIGQIEDHPWHDAEKTYYSQANLIRIKQRSTHLISLLTDFINKAKTIFEVTGLTESILFADFEAKYAVIETILLSPGLSAEILIGNQWTVPPNEIIQIIEQGLKYRDLKSSILAKYHPSVFENSYQEEIAFIEQIKTGVFKHFAIFSKHYRMIRKNWKSLMLDERSFLLPDAVHYLKLTDDCTLLGFTLDNVPKAIISCFDLHWQGSISDWETLSEITKWVSRFNFEKQNITYTEKIYKAAATKSINESQVKELKKCYQEINFCISSLCQDVGWPEHYFENESINHVLTRISLLDENNSKGAQWAAFEGALQKAVGTISEQFMRLAYHGQIPIKLVPQIFLRSVYQAVIDSIITDDQILRDFHSLSHDEKVNYFKQLDGNIKNENKTTLISNMRFAAQERLDTPMAQEGMGHLRREFARQRRFTPLRKTIKLSEYAIRSIKPCFLMSPLSVAQYLQGDHPSFDLVVFDEASQLPTEDALGAICRGKQLIVVGDPKQLPPTNFFMLQSSIMNSEVDEEGNNVIEDTESVLEEFQATGLPSARLKWHYRSTNENLISFSNHTFYDSDLYTFPSCSLKSENSGLHFRYVPDGLYEGKGLNQSEARAVVDAIIVHAKADNGLSLGVGTFNMRQQLAILDEIELRRRQDPSLEPFFDRSKVEPFFVKNLENIQGDERDIIFISVTYAKDISGRLRYNFGPINKENGWRRLNVLITRARKMMVVFSSIKGEEISPAIISSRGPQLIRDFLLFAETGKLQSTSLGHILETESPFEKDVMLELLNRGYLIDPQVGTSGYRIDLGVRHISLPGLFICGIECDGVTYHSSETARDRDRLRQAVLESRGWQIIRIWSTDWFKERQAQIQRIVDFIENARQNYIEQSEDKKKISDNIDENEHRTEILEGSINDDINVISIPEFCYKRPIIQQYTITQLTNSLFQRDISGLSPLTNALAGVVAIEGPIHWDLAFTRVSSFIWKRRGARINSSLKYALESALSRVLFKQVDDFLYNEGQLIQVRNRAGLKLTADYICQEELEAAIIIVVEAAKMIPREKLILEIIAVLGVVRSPVSKTAIDKAIQALYDKKMLGEGSMGLARM